MSKKHKQKTEVKSIKVSKMYRAAQFDESTVDVEARTVELSFSSEAPYERYFGVEILGHAPNEVRLERMNNGGAVCVDHRTSDQVGVVEKCWVGSDRMGRALVRFGKSNRANEIFQDVIDGIRKNTSVGYDVHKMVLMQSEAIDNGKSTLDTYRVTDWEPLEISLVAVPADTQCGVGREREENEHEIIIEIPKKEEKQVMKKCNICGAEYEGNDCPVCARAKEAAEAKSKEAEKFAAARVNDILAMGQKHEMLSEAQKAIAEGKSVQEFKDLVIDKISAKRLDFGSGDSQAAKKPYRSLGEQMVDIAEAVSERGSASRERLLTAQRSITGMSTSVPSDGGYLVQPDFTTVLLDKVQEAAQVAPLCTKIPVGPSADSLEAPFIDETSRATGSRWGGVQVYRESEAVEATSKKPKLGLWEVRLFDLKGLCYVTNRLLQDATALESIVMKSFQSEFAFKLDDEIIRGTGAGQCTGILNAGCLVTITKETGQKAATINIENINKMYNALFASSRGKAVWFYNQECEPDLETLSLAIGTGGVSWPLFTGPGMGMNGSATAKLKGLPAIPIEQCSALGTAGDLILADPSGYVVVDKGGLDAQSSIHARFIYDETAFKFTYRVNGAPILRSAVAPYKGSVSHSHFVTLGART